MPDLTPEKRAELRRASHYNGLPTFSVNRDTLKALLDAADERDRLATQVERVREVVEQYDADARHEPYGGELWSTTASTISAALNEEPAAGTRHTPPTPDWRLW